MSATQFLIALLVIVCFRDVCLNCYGELRANLILSQFVVCLTPLCLLQRFVIYTCAV